MLTYTEVSKNKTYSVLLILIFLVIISGLGFVLGQIYGSPEILIFAVIFSFGSAFVSYFAADKIALSMSGAIPLTKEQAPELYRTVENLSMTAGLPMPRVYIINDAALNAFATGRNPQNAAVAVTSGLLQKLNQTELEGVIAHELSHVGNYDIRFMALVMVLVGTVSLLSNWFFRFSFLGNRKKEGSNPIFLLIGLGLLILSPIIATLIKLAVSRKREFLADASGALLTRYPEGLASALEKISTHSQPLSTANTATAHLFISNPLKNNLAKSQSWFTNLFNTHPPADERIRRLREMGR
ncbi:MAG: M48 family metallopeptidase [Candidatus Doudnabacteria bacterium]